MRRYAIGLGCEMHHASALVYTDDLDASADGTCEPIGISCRICEQRNCHQRSVPSLERDLQVNSNKLSILPYQIN